MWYSLALIATGVAAYYVWQWRVLFIIYLNYLRNPVSKAELVAGNVYRVSYMRNGQRHEIYFPLRQEGSGGVRYFSAPKTVMLAQESCVPFFITGVDIGPDVTMYSYDLGSE